ncbi:glucans biosynthesis glucosyltransferase MdoH [bacterium]|nr:glucans biosynthesis glucosyltransferase MdoH [bacterium]
MEHFPTVPPLAPRAMPIQDLSARGQARRFKKNPPGTLAARLITFGGAVLLTVFATWQMYLVVSANQVSLSEALFVALFSVSFGWIALSACAALAGTVIGSFVKVVLKHWSSFSGASVDAPTGAVLSNKMADKVALVMPIHNESPAEYCAALHTMANDLADSGHAEQFEIFILSDTTEITEWLSETAAVAQLREQLKSLVPVWYRRRRFNTARKAGNIREFVECWGARYESMIVLDADSLMRGDTILALVRSMQSDPSLGIVQSVPTLVSGHTLFARLQQFASSVYGPIVANGVSFWQGRDGNYWGHNAIIRLQAFAEASGLPELPGRRPLGGEIMSHDFVEAALVRKAGWGVIMLPALSGSWENSPPSLLDLAIRDRRWAQGNIQHLAVVGSRDLAWPNRVHFLTGVMSYASSALWLALIAAGLLLSVQSALIKPEYFKSYPSLFPDWPTFDSERMLSVFMFSMLALFVPKILGALRVLFSKARRKSHGGTVRFILSLLLEVVLSALLAPVLMLMQVRQLWQIVRGQDSGWALQSRTSNTLPWRVVWQRHWAHVATGIFLTIGLWFMLPSVLPWMMPVIVGLLGAVVLSRWSADVRIGRRLARARLLLTPEEQQVPLQLQLRDDLLADYRQVKDEMSVRELLEEPSLADRHFSMLDSRSPERVRGQPDSKYLTLVAKLSDAESIDELLQWLDKEETLVLLSDPALFKQASCLTNDVAEMTSAFDQSQVNLKAIVV